MPRQTARQLTLGTPKACAGTFSMREALVAGGSGGVLRPRRGARGAEPPRMIITSAFRRGARGAQPARMIRNPLCKKKREGQRPLADHKPSLLGQGARGHSRLATGIA